MYADCFKIQTIHVAKEVGGPWSKFSDKPEPYGIHYEKNIRCQIVKSFIFEWILRSQFNSATLRSRDQNYRPHLVKTLADTFNESKKKNMYQKYLENRKKVDKEK